ncbi:hypothetical protein EVAR_66846_1 [Eumeta japonica]|uniref:Uncharacterized protein n=1 Tax=Eumeta variegata TaxID=151549 RepID=A0A4C1Z9I7_EUMVA|nr:hypothetical protein EVAR_66846_1 [Eumeta japonica]
MISIESCASSLLRRSAGAGAEGAGRGLIKYEAKEHLFLRQNKYHLLSDIVRIRRPRSKPFSHSQMKSYGGDCRLFVTELRNGRRGRIGWLPFLPDYGKATGDS